MCDAAFTIASLALSGVKAVAGYAQQNAQYKAQMRERENAIRRRQAEAIARYGEIQADTARERRQTDERIADDTREGRRQRASAQVRRGEAGVTGLSVQALQRDLAGRTARAVEGARSDQRDRETAAQRRMDAEAMSASHQIAGMPTPRPPSALSAGLQVAGQALSAARGFAPRGA